MQEQSEQYGMISVVVPVYNIKPYLEHCLDSICGQTYENLEIITVDDGSTDGSGDILEDYAKKDARIKVLHQENSGVTSARLYGVREASGEYIGFVDGDDEIEPDFYELLIKNAIQYHADISHCGYQLLLPDGRVHYFYNTGRLVQQDRTTGLKDLLEGSMIEPGLWNKLFHKSLFHSLLHEDKIPRDLKINEDLLMNYYLFSESVHSVFEDVCKYRYYSRSSSATRREFSEHKIYDPLKVRRLILHQCSEELHPLAQRKYLETCIATYTELEQENSKAHALDRRYFRDLIRTEIPNFHYLSGKMKRRARFILAAPRLFGVVRRFYANHIQVKIYE